MDEEDFKRRLNNIERKEMLVGIGKTARKEREEEERARATQKRWLILTIIGSRLYTLQKAFEVGPTVRRRIGEGWSQPFPGQSKEPRTQHSSESCCARYPTALATVFQSQACGAACNCSSPDRPCYS